MDEFREMCEKPPFLAIFDRFSPFWARLGGWAQNENFPGKIPWYDFLTFGYIGSCKKLEKSNGRFLRYKVNTRTDGAIYYSLPKNFRGTKK